MTQFERCLVHILAHEGGYSVNPRDPGGETKYGISKRAYPEINIASLTIERAKEIYKADYWRPLSADDLPAGVALQAFDFGVNAGVSRSAKLLQRIAGVPEDGKVGPKTIAAIGKMEPSQVISRFTAGRMDHYRALSAWSTFGKGWTRRTLETEAAALAMHAPFQSPKPVPRPSLWARIVSAFTR